MMPYPNGIKNGEENDRQLFQKCRDYHIIRTEDATAQTEYKLHEGRIVKRAVYIALGIDMNGKKDVLGM